MRSSEFYMFKRNKFPFSDAIHQFEICNMNIIKNQLQPLSLLILMVLLNMFFVTAKNLDDNDSNISDN